MTAGASLDARVVVRRGGFFGLDVAVDAAPGEVVAVMGPSGAGKSTLLAVLAGLLRDRAGHVRVDGRTVSGPAAHLPPQQRGVVLLGQDPHLFPHLSVRENVAFGLGRRRRQGPRGQGPGERPARPSRAEVRADAEAWLHRVGLDGHGDRRPASLSGGQRQRVALARALATRPRVLLLDEPLASLDPATAADVRVMLGAQLSATGTTALLVTHAVVDAVALAARLVLIEDGSITQHGPVRQVLTAPRTAFGAALAGVNRVPGRIDGGVWRSAAFAVPAPGLRDGDAVAFVPPEAVRVRHADSAASPASPGCVSWSTRVVCLDATVAGVRVQTAAPVVAVDVPVTALAVHVLAPGSPLLLEVDPRLVRIEAG